MLQEPSFATAITRMQASGLKPSEKPYVALTEDKQLPLRQLYLQRAVLAAQDIGYTGDHDLAYKGACRRIDERSSEIKPVRPVPHYRTEASRYCLVCNRPGRQVIFGEDCCIICATAMANRAER